MIGWYLARTQTAARYRNTNEMMFWDKMSWYRLHVGRRADESITKKGGIKLIERGVFHLTFYDCWQHLVCSASVAFAANSFLRYFP